ncbi:RNA polymerase II holoenzyme cyclin-like subunit [Bombardia bombarda]|uniref:RNA polymerase II holoenzyme cyclin-like subunit n=1 Tax=Bombardia bombarda TaxID=252184 RepID=A0AA39XIP1_9PEZI|nr:RNA polymerase II holoenzyme cyclin-like subunit [Bombardia bombarda]
MAANYWESTQRRHWQFTKDELAAMRQRLEDEDPGLVQSFPLPPLRHLNIYFNQQINRLGKRLGVRQQAMATAQVYAKRFYTKVEIRRTNPYLLLTTAMYLACKMEECPQHIRLITQEARLLWPTEFHNQDTSKVGECEFFLISEMNSHLIIHQPYRTLTALQADFQLNPEEVSLAWCVINDHYMTDLPLLYPPHIIALTAILFALVSRPPNASSQGSANAAAAAASSGLSAATAALAQAQARSAMNAGGGGGGGGGSMPGTPSLTPQSSSAGGYGGSDMSSIAAMDVKKAPEQRMGKVQRFAGWLADSNIDVTAMVDCTQELISFYECHEAYNDKNTREQVNRFMKARNL